MRHVARAVAWFVLASLGGAAAAESAYDQVTVELPPASLAQWYRPQNQRQVWLHTMFRLRQALQAVGDYAARGDAARTIKWAAELEQTYAKLPQMVPEWEAQSRQPLAAAVLDAARRGDRAALDESLDRLARKCEGCHRQWKGVVTALYRSPDYTEVRVPAAEGEAETDFLEAMERLADTLNTLKTAREEEELAAARAAAGRLGNQLKQLAASCASCHREPASRERILGAATFDALRALGEALREPHDAQVSGRHLGTVGFTVCGRCHGIHRTLSDLRTRLLR